MRIPIYDGKGKMVAAATIDDDDPLDVQVFRWRLDAYGYAVRTSKPALGEPYGRPISMHRHVLDRAFGDGSIVDHINQNRLDNRRSNLRVVDLSDNGHNSKLSARNTTGVRNVTRTKNGTFAVSIKRRGVCHNIGGFKTIEEAAVAAENARALLVAGGAS